MNVIKKNKNMIITFTLIFAVFYFLFSVVNKEKTFYANFENYYKQEMKSYTLEKLTLDDFKTIRANPTVEKELVFPGFDWQNNYELYFSSGVLRDIDMVEGKFFSKDQKDPVIVCGRLAFARLPAVNRKSHSIEVLGSTYKIQGVMQESPFDETILFNGYSEEFVSKFGSKVYAMNVQAKSKQALSSFQQELEATLGERLIQSIDSQAPQKEDFEINAEQFKIFYLQLIVFAGISVLVQMVQRLEIWKKEIAVRKMVGGYGFHLVFGTYKKYLQITGIALVASGIICGVVTMLAKEWLLFTPEVIGQSILQILLIYMVLNILSFLICVLFVRKYSVQEILQEAGNE